MTRTKREWEKIKKSRKKDKKKLVEDLISANQTAIIQLGNEIQEIKKRYLLRMAKLSDCEIVYTNEEWVKAIDNAKKGEMIIFDEAKLTLGSKRK